jgi:hypothetical protein
MASVTRGTIGIPFGKVGDAFGLRRIDRDERICGAK